ncbi:hypothetical protein GCM10010917_23210 [Paenibacillus physcomitrellae]|uniref:Uncharacterized protein n=1 Tax=Paenibacillus physcomitrellae TaxID=1619311 RepID=A0ABQ1G5Y8_9BACL|nr:hypothetical protein GCM10010917_23210 [Paenibacillus physcomitrellae]
MVAVINPLSEKDTCEPIFNIGMLLSGITDSYLFRISPYFSVNAKIKLEASIWCNPKDKWEAWLY